jgi:hypothetical protein
MQPCPIKLCLQRVPDPLLPTPTSKDLTLWSTNDPNVTPSSVQYSSVSLGATTQPMANGSQVLYHKELGSYFCLELRLYAQVGPRYSPQSSDKAKVICFALCARALQSCRKLLHDVISRSRAGMERPACLAPDSLPAAQRLPFCCRRVKSTTPSRRWRPLRRSSQLCSFALGCGGSLK